MNSQKMFIIHETLQNTPTDSQPTSRALGPLTRGTGPSKFDATVGIGILMGGTMFLVPKSQDITPIQHYSKNQDCLFFFGVTRTSYVLIKFWEFEH